MSKISIVKLRNNGGNAVITIPVAVMKETNWALGNQQLIVQYDQVNKLVTIKPVSLEAIT